LITVSVPSVSAIGISKQVACKQPDGFHEKSVYILWKWEIPYVDSFVKFRGKLYYFIHQFPSSKARDEYRKWENSPLTNSGFVPNQWTSLVEFDCARSKVKFLPIQEKTGKAYGKILWSRDGWLGYTYTRPNIPQTCKIQEDAIYDMKTGESEKIDQILDEYPPTDEQECYTRNLLQYTGSGTVKLQVERKILSDGGSFYFPYLYYLGSNTWKLLEKSTISEEEAMILTESGTIDDYIEHKKTFSPGITFTQTDTMTNILYRGTVIKSYPNKEYPIVLLRDMNTQKADCANSERSTSSSDIVKNQLGKDYLRQCLITEMRYYPKDYILFFGPSIDGHTVSIYDIGMKKFFHHIIGTTTQIRFVKGKGLVYITSHPWLYCNASVWHFQNGKTKKIFDECTFENKGGSHVLIDSAVFGGGTIDISYRPLRLIGNNYVPGAREKYSIPY
jgi:hypothetical protein